MGIPREENICKYGFWGKCKNVVIGQLVQKGSKDVAKSKGKLQKVQGNVIANAAKQPDENAVIGNSPGFGRRIKLKKRH